MRGDTPPHGFEVYFRSWRLFYSTRLILAVLAANEVLSRRFASAVILALLFGSGLGLLYLDMWRWERSHPDQLDVAYRRANPVMRLAAFTRRPRSVPSSGGDESP